MFFGMSGYGITLSSTGSHILSKRSYRDFLSGNFKSAARRTGWFSRNFLGTKIIFSDREYNFTENLSLEELSEVEARLKDKLEKQPSNINLKSDLVSVYCEMLKLGSARSSELLLQTETLCNEIIEYSQEQLPNLPKTSQRAQKTIAMDADFAREALRDFSEIFPPKDWNWYLVSGTFLGLIREGKFLESDYDIDFGFHAEDFELDRFLKVLDTNPNFTCRKIDYQSNVNIDQTHTIKSEKKLTVLKLVYKKRLNIDLFIHHLEGRTRWHGSSFHRWDNSEFELENYNLLGVNVKGPKDFERYLSENYGDWRTPVTDFELATGTPNLKIVNNFDSISIFFRRLSLLESSQKVNAIMKALEQGGFINSDQKFSFVLK